MTNAELKEAFGKMGVSAEDTNKVLERFDAEKISEIVEEANTPEEAFEAIHKAYPELEVEKMKEQVNFFRDQLETAAKEYKEKSRLNLQKANLKMLQVAAFGEMLATGSRVTGRLLLLELLLLSVQL